MNNRERQIAKSLRTTEGASAGNHQQVELSAQFCAGESATSIEMDMRSRSLTDLGDASDSSSVSTKGTKKERKALKARRARERLIESSDEGAARKYAAIDATTVATVAAATDDIVGPSVPLSAPSAATTQETAPTAGFAIGSAVRAYSSVAAPNASPKILDAPIAVPKIADAPAMPTAAAPKTLTATLAAFRANSERGVRTGAEASTEASLKELASIQRAVKEAVLRAGLKPDIAMSIFDAASRYDALVAKLVVRNGVLEGRMDAPRSAAQPSNTFATPSPAPAPVAAPRTRKAVETWSAVVTSSDANLSSKQVADKILKEVAPSLGVRVHEVRELKRGGAVIRTPSVSELKRVVANTKFNEVGLQVAKSKGLLPKVTIVDVDTSISPEVFMDELYQNNFKEEFSPAAFKKSVHLETKSWSVTNGARINLTLEVDEKALAVLDKTGRVYIKWFSYRCRSLVRTYACHRCVGFDHKVSQCRFKSEVCRQCGQPGHIAAKCTSPVDCRNCRFKGLPSGHYMLSEACPIYGAVLARVQARH